MASTERRYYAELEGIRGYAFLMVFFAHYLTSLITNDHAWTRPLWVGLDIAWLAVPIFFVLSGFLITNILIRTREREGYFAIFYIRRALRVFPLYYTILIAIGAIVLLSHGSLHGYWVNFFYLQSILLNPKAMETGVAVGRLHLLIAHFWSLAIEEHFYAAWPVVVWFCRSRRSLAIACLSGCGIATVVRMLAPVLHITPFMSYFATITRFDAMLLGGLIALYYEDARYKQVERMALWVALAGVGTMIAVSAVTGTSSPMGITGWVTSHWRTNIMIPVVNITAAAVIIETMRRNSLLQRVCSQSLICKFGALSYGMYALHFIYIGWISGYVQPAMQRYVPHMAATLLAIAFAFGMTLVLAILCYRLIEVPAMRMKERFKYAEKIETVNTAPASEQAASFPSQSEQIAATS